MDALVINTIPYSLKYVYQKIRHLQKVSGILGSLVLDGFIPLCYVLIVPSRYKGEEGHKVRAVYNL